MAGRSASLPSVEMTRTCIFTVQFVQPGGGGGAVTTAEEAPSAVSAREARSPPSEARGVRPTGGRDNSGKATGPSGRDGMDGGATGPSRSDSIGTPLHAGP